MEQTGLTMEQEMQGLEAIDELNGTNRPLSFVVLCSNCLKG
jgi:hypothetical protein